jgi:DNA-binding transcriptional LysR family regulator
MRLRQLMYLARIIESGSLTRASQLLHIAQPALSQQVNQLEDELGVKLLSRSVRGVLPTEAGLAVYHQAKLILKQVEATRQIAIQADSGPAGTVTIGLPWSITAMLGLDLLRAVRAKLKLVRLEIVEGPSSLLANLLAAGKLEIAVLFSDTMASGTKLRLVVTEPLLFVGPVGSLAGKHGLTLSDAAAYPFILMSSPNAVRATLETHWVANRLRYEVTAEINSPPLLLDAIKAGFGYAIVPASGLESAIQNGEIDAVELADGPYERDVFIGSSRLFSHSAGAEQVSEILREVMRGAVLDGRWKARLPDTGADTSAR